MPTTSLLSAASPVPSPPLLADVAARRPTVGQQPLRKRMRKNLHPAHARYHVAGPGPPSAALPPSACRVSLPDELLVCILRFVDDASLLARLRTVCTQWCRVIDNTPAVWADVSFRRACFARRVVRHQRRLALSHRCGSHAVALAARAGNQWAFFLQRFLFDRHTLRAITIAQPTASLLVTAGVQFQSRPFPPWHDCAPRPGGVWIAVHAARWSHALHDAASDAAASSRLLRTAHARLAVEHPVPPLPGGAVVGMIHVSDATYCAGATASSAPCWVWRIDRAVALRRPVRCAGFVGLWPMSAFLNDLVVHAMLAQ